MNLITGRIMQIKLFQTFPVTDYSMSAPYCWFLDPNAHFLACIFNSACFLPLSIVDSLSEGRTSFHSHLSFCPFPHSLSHLIVLLFFWISLKEYITWEYIAAANHYARSAHSTLSTLFLCSVPLLSSFSLIQFKVCVEVEVNSQEIFFKLLFISLIFLAAEIKTS